MAALLSAANAQWTTGPVKGTSKDYIMISPRLALVAIISSALLLAGCSDNDSGSSSASSAPAVSEPSLDLVAEAPASSAIPA
jgi:hypothetical protein